MRPGRWCKLFSFSPPRVDELVGKGLKPIHKVKVLVRSQRGGAPSALLPPWDRFCQVWYGFTCQPLDRHQPFHRGLCSSDGDGGRGDDSLDSIGRLRSSGRGARAPWQPSESCVAVGLLCDAAFGKGMKLWETAACRVCGGISVVEASLSSSTGWRLISAEASMLPVLQARSVCQCDSNKFCLWPFSTPV